VRTIRHSANEDRARIVIDLSRPSAFQTRLTADSSALVIEIPDAVSESSMGEVAVGKHRVRSITARTSTAEPGLPRVRVTVLLDGAVSWECFALPPLDSRPARVVLDVRAAPVAASTGGVETAVRSPVAGGVGDTLAGIGRAAPRPFVVAVDAGHGGHDTGAVGRYGLLEKKLVLDIARRVADSLNARPGIRAVLTRERDEYLTLPQRNEIAEKLGADVFVSIHLNSAPSATARGVEIYFVAPAGAERAADQVLSSGEAADEFGLDGRRDGDIVHMLLDVNQQSVLARSEQLAVAILEQVRERRLMPTRTVKQKSFSVLRTISMPSVLVEAGFLSNASDAKLVRDASGRDRVARAIAEGVVDFFRLHPPQRGGGQDALIHRVQRGDTLWTISRRYRTTIERLCELNGFSPAHQLRVGQEIVIRRD
jgi:N-acetylmuramoyl-L-alanine amidase